MGELRHPAERSARGESGKHQVAEGRTVQVTEGEQAGLIVYDGQSISYNNVIIGVCSALGLIN